MIYTDISYFRRRQLAGRLSTLKCLHGPSQIDPRWLLDNDEGKKNFSVWLESLYKQLPANLKPSQCCLKRRDESLPWLQENCYLSTLKEEFAKKPREALDPKEVTQIVDYITNNPSSTLVQIARLHGVSVATASKIRRFNKAGKYKKGLQ